MPSPTNPNRLGTSNQNNAFGDPSKRKTSEVTSSMLGARSDCERWENLKRELY